MERRCSKQKPQYVPHTSEVHFCLLLLVVQTPENTSPVEQAENTPNRTHFRAVVDNQIPAYRTSLTIYIYPGSLGTFLKGSWLEGRYYP